MKLVKEMNNDQKNNVIINETNNVFNRVVKTLKRGQVEFDFLTESNTFGFITIKKTNYKVLDKVHDIINLSNLIYTKSTVFETDSQVYIKISFKFD